ncbi:hypothetical protein [Ohtaekwangia koreensis]|uniref:Uncharacterized protein n=1 Tax=Ohtaekwangia koreensis TaxID=688867 RepID=A0A1T5MCM5_9BACT|nr:hypothetical protein [Ohtaekwangia koreensis]SKC85970.1 hypothetical protein SAMN05660236_5014 [Ohtaekwangia koreensis]
MKFLKYLFVMFIAISAFSCDDEAIVNNDGDDDDDPIIIGPPKTKSTVALDTLSNLPQ